MPAPCLAFVGRHNHMRYRSVWQPRSIPALIGSSLSRRDTRNWPGAASDIQSNLLDIEPLTSRLRLVVASLETAKEVRVESWEHDPWWWSGRTDVHTTESRTRRRPFPEDRADRSLSRVSIMTHLIRCGSRKHSAVRRRVWAHDLICGCGLVGARIVGSRLTVACVAIKDARAVIDALADPAHVVRVRRDRGEDVEARDEGVGRDAVDAVS